MYGQDPLEVAEDHSILLVWKRTAFFDLSDRFAGFLGQVGGSHSSDVLLFLSRAETRRREL